MKLYALTQNVKHKGSEPRDTTDVSREAFFNMHNEEGKEAIYSSEYKSLLRLLSELEADDVRIHKKFITEHKCREVIKYHLETNILTTFATAIQLHSNVNKNLIHHYPYAALIDIGNIQTGLSDEQFEKLSEVLCAGITNMDTNRNDIGIIRNKKTGSIEIVIRLTTDSRVNDVGMLTSFITVILRDKRDMFKDLIALHEKRNVPRMKHWSFEYDRCHYIDFVNEMAALFVKRGVKNGNHNGDINLALSLSCQYQPLMALSTNGPVNGSYHVGLRQTYKFMEKHYDMLEKFFVNKSPEGEIVYTKARGNYSHWHGVYVSVGEKMKVDAEQKIIQEEYNKARELEIKRAKERWERETGRGGTTSTANW